LDIKKKCHTTGELQFYAPYIRREINCHVAITEEYSYYMYVIMFSLIFCTDGWSFMQGKIWKSFRCGIGKGRSTTENLFVLKYVLEKV